MMILHRPPRGGMSIFARLPAKCDDRGGPASANLRRFAAPWAALALMAGLIAGCGAVSPWSLGGSETAQVEADGGGEAGRRGAAARSDRPLATAGEPFSYQPRASAAERRWRGAGPFVMGGAYTRYFEAPPRPLAELAAPRPGD